MDKRADFYSQIINKKISDKNSTILIVGGCKFDRDIFFNAGFQNVTVTGLDLESQETNIAPFTWKREDATALSFGDKSFDYVVAHACIHHASKPHQMLLEMYRVASKGLLAFESRDSALLRILAYINLTQTYEHAAVHFNESKCGGVDNTDIPNYVFRWTEREIEKTIRSYSPFYEHEYIYSYGSSDPCTPNLEHKNSIKKGIIILLKPFYTLFILIFKKQQNLFSFLILKTENREKYFPWLSFDESEKKVIFNKEWGRKKYRDTKNI